MRVPRSVLRTELKRSPGLAAAPLLVACFSAVFVTGTTSNMRLWTEYAHSFVYSMVLAGPLAAGAGAVVATRERRHSLGELLTTTSRAPLARHLARLSAILAWVLGAYAVTAMIIGFLVAADATWGSPDLVLLASGAAALAGFTMLGYLMGIMAPHPVTPPLVIAFTWVGHFIASTFFPALFPLVPGVGTPPVGSWL